MTTPKILAFAGSTRTASFNKKLVQIAADGARATGADVTYIDLRDLPMPIFDEDLEAANGLPDTVVQFKDLLKAHHGFLIACPEYNGSITPLLKNAIDWASRPNPQQEEAPLACFRDKTAVLMSASPGALGGLRGLVHVRAILGNIGVVVLPDQKAVPRAYEAFDSSGNLTDEKTRIEVYNLGNKLATVTGKLI